MKWRAFLPVLLSIAACGPGEDAVRAPGLGHLFPAGEAEALDLARVGRLEPVAAIGLESFRREASSPGVATAPPVEPAFLAVGALEARSLDLLEVDVEGLPAPAGATLAWSVGAAGPGAAASATGQPRTATVVARVPSHTGVARQTLRFDLAAEPFWRGPIEGLALRFAGAAGSFRLVAVRASKRVLPAAELARMSGRVYRVELSNEVREAVVLLPGEPFRQKLRAAPGSRIRLAVAATPGIAAPVSVRVRLEPRVVGATAPVELLRSFGADPAELSTWLEWQLPAGAFEGELSVEWVAAAKAPPGTAGGADFVFLATPAVVPAKRSGGPNVLIISLDTLRADRMSLYGYPRATSPEIAAWAGKRGVVFESAVAPAGSTLPSHTSMFTGLDVLHHGATGSAPAGDRLETLAERFRDHGYTTRAWTGGAFLDPRFGLGQGFEVFRYWPRGEVEASREIEDGFGRAREWLRAGLEEPFFLFLHSYEIHGPYRAREPWWQSWGSAADSADAWERAKIWPRSRAAESQKAPAVGAGEDPFRPFGQPVAQFGRFERPLVPAELRHAGDFYDSGIAKADLEVGRLLSELERLGLSERTIVVLTSDHGESLGEHGLWSHGYLFEDNLRVPLVFAIPGGRAAGRRIAEPVGLVDIAPTLLALAGLPAPEGIDGRSLAAWLESGKPEGPHPTYLSYAWDTRQGVALRRGSDKLVMRDSLLAPVGYRELYDLETDPEELDNLAAKPTADRRLDELRREAWRRLVAPRQPGVTFQVTNRGARAATAVVRLGGLAAADLRAAAPPCAGCVGLTPLGDLELRLPPGELVRFWAAVDRPQLEFFLELPAGGPVHRQELARERFCGKALDISPENPHGLVVTAAMEGSCAPEAGASGGLEDASLRARLEALGYL